MTKLMTISLKNSSFLFLRFLPFNILYMYFNILCLCNVRVVKFYPCFNFFFPLLHALYHTFSITQKLL